MNLGRVLIAAGAGLAVFGWVGVASAQGMGGGMGGMGMGGMGMGGMGGFGSQSGPAQQRAAPQYGAVASAGRVRDIDANAGTLTLRHASIPSIGMPAMTMVFAVAEPEMLEAVRPGDAVSFVMQGSDGRYTVTGIEAVR